MCLDCPVGQKSATGAGVCIECDSGYAAPEPGSAVCDKCDATAGQTSTAASMTCALRCTRGFAFNEWSNETNRCQQCPDDSTECVEEGYRVENVEIQPGYWRQFDWSGFVPDTSIRECSFPGCVGGNVTGEYCAPGHQGPLCASCEFPGFVRTVDGECNVCTPASTAAAILPPIFAVLFVVLVVMVIKVYMANRGITLFGKDAEKDMELFNSLMTKLKVVTTTCQIMGNFVATFKIKYPKAFTTFARRVLGFFNLDFLAIVPVGCVFEQDFHSRLVFTTLVPIGLAVVICLIHYKDLKRSVPWLLVGSYAVFPSVSTVVFQTWGCESFDEGVYLKSDYNIDCNSPDHEWYKVYAW